MGPAAWTGQPRSDFRGHSRDRTCPTSGYRRSRNRRADLQGSHHGGLRSSRPFLSWAGVVTPAPASGELLLPSAPRATTLCADLSNPGLPVTPLQPIRGTHDLIGEEQRRHQHVIDTARRVAALYGFDEWVTPIFEDTRVFSRTLGETSDVVTKEMYSFTDRGGEAITLRPEATAGVCRALVSNGLTQSLPQKVFCRRADVPLRAAAEGPLPPVPPDRHRVDRPGRAAGRRRSDRLRLGHPGCPGSRHATPCWR